MNRAVCLCLLLLVAFSFPAVAELPPDAYRKMQDGAAEALQIKVQSVSSKETKQNGDVLVDYTVRAKVQKVERSASGVKPADMITIRYEQRRRAKPMPGPSEVPTLTKGKSYPAFLRSEKKGGFSPAAGGQSFAKTGR
jgi:hypothetical protein